jgi:hypothetical protein
MGTNLFQWPVNCAGLVQELMTDAVRDVTKSVLDGIAFQNPMGASSDAMMEDITEGAQTLLDNWNESGNDLAELNSIMTNIGIAYDETTGEIIETAGPPGGSILGNIQGAKDFGDMLSGADGNEQSMAERLGLASAYNSLQQQVNGQIDQFTNMYNLFGPQAEALFNDTDTQMRAVATIMRSTLGADTINNITGLLGGIDELTGDVAGLLSIVNGDNSAFQIAAAFVQKAGIAQMITGGNNCFIEDLIKNRPIGTDNLLENFQGAIDEKLAGIGQIAEDQLAAIQELATQKIEQIKSLGVQAQEIASMIGTSQAQDEILEESENA